MGAPRHGEGHRRGKKGPLWSRSTDLPGRPPLPLQGLSTASGFSTCGCPAKTRSIQPHSGCGGMAVLSQEVLVSGLDQEPECGRAELPASGRTTADRTGRRLQRPRPCPGLLTDQPGAEAPFTGSGNGEGYKGQGQSTNTG